MKSKIKLGHTHTHKFYKLISLLGFGIIGASAIVTIPFVSTSCGRGESYIEKEVKKCNYTVMGYNVTSNSVSELLDLYIGEGIKGYISGRIYLGDINSTNRTCAVIGGQDFAAIDIYLPKYVSINDVTYTINNYSFGNFNITNIQGKVVIPNKIYSWNFKNCSQLTQAIFLDTTEYVVPAEAFYGCTGLTSIDISKSTIAIGRKAFYGCTNLANVNISSSVTEIIDYAFCGCSSLVNFNIPDGVTILGNSAFEGCSSLTEINIPKGIASLHDATFSGCSSLTNVIIPNNITWIDTYAFYGCSSLTSIIVPDSVTKMASNIFNGCSSLTSASIHISKLSNNLFTHCTALTSLTLSSTTFVSAVGSALGSTPFTSDEREGAHIYVPSNLLETYIQDEAWINCIGSDYIESVFAALI